MKLLWGSYNFRGLYSELVRVLVRRRRSEKVLLVQVKGSKPKSYEYKLAHPLTEGHARQLRLC